MEENKLESAPETSSQTSMPMSPTQTPKKNRKWLWIGLGVVVVLGGLFTYGILQVMNQINKAKDGGGGTASGSTSAAYKLYDALGNAVGQQKLRVAMLRTTYANKADADSGQHIGSQQSSVSAMDTAALTYANVFVSNVGGEDSGFTAGRCVSKVPYANKDAEAAGIKTLAAATDRLKQTLPQVPVGGVADSCSQYGVAPGANVQLAWARLSDGIMPVTLEQPQAKDWAEKMKGTALFTVTDEGMTTKDSKQLRKYSFKPKVESDRIGVTLDDIFKQASHVEELQRQHPGTSYAYAYLPLSATLASGAEGFYLIDEKTSLPVYSEINSIAKDKPNDGKAPSRLNLARTKFSYSFGSPVTIDLNTALEFTK
jgi:hypothetical protein